jgi:hypothetical protein
MTDHLFDRERTALSRLITLVRDRAAGEASIAATYQAADDDAEREVNRARRQIDASRKKAQNEIDDRYQQTVADLGAKYAGMQTAAARKRAETVRDAEDRCAVAVEKANTEYQDRLWTLDSLLEAGEKEADDFRIKLNRQAEGARKKGEALWGRVLPTLARVGTDREEMEFAQSKLPPPTETDPEGKVEKCLEDLEASAVRVEKSFWPKLLGVGGTCGLTLLAGAAGFGIGFAVGNLMSAAIGGVAGAVVGGAILWFLVLAIARQQVRNRAIAFGVFQAETARAADRLDAHADETCRRQKSGLRRRHANDRERTHDHYRPLLARLEQQKENEINGAEVEFTDRSVQVQLERGIESRAEDQKYETAATANIAKHDAELKTAEDRHAGKIKAASAIRDRDWNALSAAWFGGLGEVSNTLTELTRFGDGQFPAFSELERPEHLLPAAVPGGVRYGEQKVDQYTIPEGEPLDRRLTPPNPINAVVPAYLPFPDRCAILLKARDEGRPKSVEALQAMMLRFLTGLPPGKVRFTIMDPVGLGDNFASFMHLADFDEQFVGARIWTEARQVEQRLLDLTEHMENVIQKYLRNQYKSIEAYNRAAGEVAEPYRVLVVANFPANFTPEAARRLLSIMTSGPSCGVCTLVSVDSRAPMPRDFRLADLEQVAFNLVWKDGKFLPTDPALATFPLTLDAPPDPATLANLVRKVGEASRDTTRVEVPFDFIMPRPDEFWTGSTARGFDVPIGRAGATKRQVFSLGRGTAQHALVAGKTGSGKSTLLHALITNLSLIYGPDEAELYLIDFKKGVEFKAYAEHKLPQARVVAIESEREFGLSVLQRLDAELKDRGDKFRGVGANDLAGYREATGKKLPRILLVVDEFQEFFVEDDKLAQEAALLLDRLVRQGRAFGLHVLLGSQTLGGAYSLARSTIDQMAVRIALQCSDTDAQLILSKDNSAARLLSRPGEAIYNDANGLVEGNDPFQVVWLDEDRKEQLLGSLEARGNGHRPPPLVFEGNIPAVIGNNPLLARLPRKGGEAPTPPSAWLGDAVAIKDPTAAVFRMHSGSNLLMIGQHEESALALMAASLVALNVQVSASLSREREETAPESPPADAGGSPGKRLGFMVLDGTPEESDLADYLRKAAAALHLDGAVVERFEMQAALADLAGEIERRQKGEAADRTPRFLFVHGLQRFRELRKTEDEYSFGRRGEKAATPGDLFGTILRDGPPVGVHSLVWCDTLTNLNRALDRPTLREFAMRVLFQMSAADSSHLIDAPLAAKLGRNRALFVQEELERPEKFRPYGLPELAWLRQFGGERKLTAMSEPQA